MPWKGPRYFPAAISCSAARAARRASSRVTVRYACTRGSRRSIRSSTACVSETGDNRRARISAAASVTVMYGRSAWSGTRAVVDVCDGWAVPGAAAAAAIEVARKSRRDTSTLTPLQDNERHRRGFHRQLDFLDVVDRRQEALIGPAVAFDAFLGERGAVHLRDHPHG